MRLCQATLRFLSLRDSTKSTCTQDIQELNKDTPPIALLNIAKDLGPFGFRLFSFSKAEQIPSGNCTFINSFLG